MKSSRKLSVLWFVSLLCLLLGPVSGLSADDGDKNAGEQQTAEAEKPAEVKKDAKPEKPAKQKDEAKKDEPKKQEPKKDEPKKAAPAKAEKKEMKEEKKKDKKPEEKPVVKSVFPDKALESAVRAEVFAKRHNDEPITAEDVAKISRVVGTAKGIQSLEGLQHCKSLMLIDLADNEFSDLSPIADLKRLQSVTLAGNKITSL
ncbi:hypothetical protein, partial [Roseibium sp.]